MDWQISKCNELSPWSLYSLPGCIICYVWVWNVVRKRKIKEFNLIDKWLDPKLGKTHMGKDTNSTKEHRTLFCWQWYIINYNCFTLFEGAKIFYCEITRNTMCLMLLLNCFVFLQFSSIIIPMSRDTSGKEGDAGWSQQPHWWPTDGIFLFYNNITTVCTAS